MKSRVSTVGTSLAAWLLAIVSAASASAQTTTDAIQRCHSYTGPESGDPDRAIAGCTAVVESDRFTAEQRLDALSARGVLFRKTGQFDLAVVDLTEVLRIRIAADDVYVERGMALVATQQPELAMKDFNESIRLNPSNTNALSQRAVAYRQKGQFDEAIRDLDRAIMLKPQDPWAVSERGLDHLSKASYDLAIRDFDRSLQLTPSSAWVIAERGSAYRLKGQFQRAIMDLTNAIALDEGRVERGPARRGLSPARASTTRRSRTSAAGLRWTKAMRGRCTRAASRSRRLAMRSGRLRTCVPRRLCGPTSRCRSQRTAWLNPSLPFYALTSFFSAVWCSCRNSSARLSTLSVN